MTVHEKLLRIENGMIDMLSVFTQWFELRYKKDNVFLGVTTMFFGLALGFLGLSLAIINNVTESHYDIAVLEILLLSVGVYMVTTKLVKLHLVKVSFLNTFRERYYKKQGSSYRTSNDYHLKKKIQLCSLVWCVVFMVTSERFNVPMLLMSTVFLFGYFSELLLACDSAPREVNAQTE